MQPGVAQGQGAPVANYPYPAPAPVQPARDYVVWSLFSTVYTNMCFLGFAALVFSIKSRDCKVMGDPEGASKNGSKAKYLNLAALAMCVLFFIIFIAVFAILASVLLRHFQHLVEDFHVSNTEPLKVK